VKKLITKIMKDRKVEFRCELCGKSVQVKLERSKDVVCSCGYIQNLNDIMNFDNKRNKVSHLC